MRTRKEGQFNICWYLLFRLVATLSNYFSQPCKSFFLKGPLVQRQHLLLVRAGYVMFSCLIWYSSAYQRFPNVSQQWDPESLECVLLLSCPEGRRWKEVAGREGQRGRRRRLRCLPERSFRSRWRSKFLRKDGWCFHFQQSAKKTQTHPGFRIRIRNILFIPREILQINTNLK